MTMGRLRGSLAALIALAWITATVSKADTSVQTRAAAAGVPPATAQAMVKEYCVGCHNARVQSGGLALDSVDITAPANDPLVWERVIAKLRAGTMPPAGSPRPDRGDVPCSGDLARTSDRPRVGQDSAPGRTSPVHRLNRTEYRNAIRDLLALEVAGPTFCRETRRRTAGSTTTAMCCRSRRRSSNATCPPRAESRAWPRASPTAGFETFDVPLLLLQDDRQNEDLPLGSQAARPSGFTFPHGEYLSRFACARTGRTTSLAWAGRTSSTSGSTAN